MQIFPRTLNYLPAIAAVGAAVAGGVVTFVVWYYFSPVNLQVGYTPEQPIPYSHRTHVGDLGLDCRYCHASVEQSQEAMIPPTQTCMGCHAVVTPATRLCLEWAKDNAAESCLDPLLESWETGLPVPWVRVHKLPEHAFFDHSVHVAVGVGCVSCHGRVDQMEVVSVQEPIAMQWCLDCHRDPMPFLRPPSQVTNMEYQRAPGDEDLIASVDEIRPPEHCSGCHR